jgi:predicted secreted hydrolase
MIRGLLLTLLASCCCCAQDWQSASSNWSYEFPRDHHAHPQFKTEWWYFTGNLTIDDQRQFGFQLTFFRHGIVPPAQRIAGRSRFIVDDLKFAHFTVTDVNGRKFHVDEKASRGAFGDAGFDRGEQIAWIEEWSLRMDTDGNFRLAASSSSASIELILTPEKRPVIHGENGVSIKATGANHASQYYSITRLSTRGTVRLGAREFRVSGSSWFDHEWATNQLAADQVGWNWLCTQLTDGTEVMLYQMRVRDGGIDPASSGTFVARDGSSVHLNSAQFSLTPTATWHSRKTGADYPIEGQVEIPSLGLSFAIKPLLAAQELALAPLVYWEGAVAITEKKGEAKTIGVGYLELTGYAGRLQALGR